MTKKDKLEGEVVQPVSLPKVAKKESPVVEAAPPPEALITFDRYFAVLGRPKHHKRGMIAFVKSIKGRKTKTEWDKLFHGY